MALDAVGHRNRGRDRLRPFARAPAPQPAATFDAAEVGRKIKGLLPDDAQLADIRARGAGRKGRDIESSHDRQWEKALALILDWDHSDIDNAPEDVSGAIQIGEHMCPVILDGKYTSSNKNGAEQTADAASKKQKESAALENSIVAFIVMHHTPDKHDGKAEDGVYIRFGTMPQKINVAKSNLEPDDGTGEQHGPFQLLGPAEVAKLRAGDPETVQLLRQKAFGALQRLDLEKYRENEGTNAASIGDRACEAANEAAHTSVVHGVSDETLGKQLVKTSDGLPEKVRAAQARELTTGLADDSSKVEVAQAAVAGLTDDKSIAAVAQAAAKSLSDEAAKQLLAELQARFAAGTNSPTS